MKTKLLPIGLTAITLLATPLMVVSGTRQAQANPLCSQQPNDQNCNHQDSVKQDCNDDASTVLVANISDNSGKVIGEVDLRWSEKCKSNWARVVSNIGTAPISATVTRQSDGLRETYSSNQDSTIYTNMVYSPGSAKACGVINGYQNCASQYGNNISVDFSRSAYRQDNPFWQAGYAPKSVNPPVYRMGNPNAKGNCTWYANGRLRELGYRASDLNRLLGDASQWADQARAGGIPTSNTPQIGAIAQWSPPRGNHVAVVEQIYGNGSIRISESSYSDTSGTPWDYLYHDTRIIAPGSASWPSTFIHVRK